MTAIDSYTFDWNFDSNVQQRETLFPLFKKVFGMEEALLKTYYASGFANPTYTPFTYFHDGRAIANVSMFDMPLLINDRKVSAAGIQSVMTDPDYRGRGLFRQLFGIMLSEIDKRYDASFLFTNKPELYKPFGFKQVEQCYFVTPLSKIAETGKRRSLRKLDLFNDENVSLIKKQFHHFTPVSRLFAPLSHAASFYLNMLDPYFNKRLYYAEDLEVIIIYEIKGGTLKLFDIIGKEIPSIEQIAALLQGVITTIELHFHPDLLGAQEFKPIQCPSHLMVRGELDLRLHFKFPVTASF